MQWLIDAVYDKLVLLLGAILDIRDISPDDGAFIVGAGSNWVGESGDTARHSLLLGQSDSPSFSGLTIDDISIDGHEIQSLANNLHFDSATSIMDFHGCSLDSVGDMELGYAMFTGMANTNYLTVYRLNTFGLQPTVDAQPCTLELWNKTGDGTDPTILNIWGVGLPASYANRELGGFFYNKTEYVIYSAAAGSGTLRPLTLEVGANNNQMQLQTNGDILIAAGTFNFTASMTPSSKDPRVDPPAGWLTFRRNGTPVKVPYYGP